MRFWLSANSMLRSLRWNALMSLTSVGTLFPPSRYYVRRTIAQQISMWCYGDARNCWALKSRSLKSATCLIQSASRVPASTASETCSEWCHLAPAPAKAISKQQVAGWIWFGLGVWVILYLCQEETMLVPRGSRYPRYLRLQDYQERGTNVLVDIKAPSVRHTSHESLGRANEAFTLRPNKPTIAPNSHWVALAALPQALMAHTTLPAPRNVHLLRALTARVFIGWKNMSTPRKNLPCTRSILTSYSIPDIVYTMLYIHHVLGFL